MKSVEDIPGHKKVRICISDKSPLVRQKSVSEGDNLNTKGETTPNAKKLH